MGAYPQIADWNEDGLIDLLVGDTDGRITLYINNGAVGNPQLTSKGLLKANGITIDVGDRASPVVVDWDNNGKKDLVIGDDDGYVRLYLNSGTNSNPSFTTYNRLQMGANPIKTSKSASPEVCDLDDDGKKDLIVSDYSGYVWFFKNMGDDGNPVFSSQERLQSGGSHMKVGSSYARIEIVDWDEDGDLDILLGEMDAYINLCLNNTISSSVADDPSNLPVNFILGQNYPNPFNATTRISYQLARPAKVRVSIYNLSGQLIDELVDQHQGPGNYSVSWDAKNQNSGIYFYKLSTGEFTITKKCILQK